jgi:hypothetical protein
MPAGEYLLGAGIAIATLGSSAAAAALVVRRRAPVPEPAARAVAWAVLATAFVLAIHLIPGALGILGRGSVATCGLVLLAVVVALVPVVPRGGSVPLPGAPRETAASTWIAALGVAAVSVYLLANLLSHADQALIQSDVTSFPLPNVAAWIQDRSTWPVVD